MCQPEEVPRPLAHEADIAPLILDFMGVYEAIAQEVAAPEADRDRDHIGYWRRAGENSIRNYSVSGEGYSDLGERVSCTIIGREEGLDIATRLPDIFDNRCQLFFVRHSDRENTMPFVLKTPVMPSHPTEDTDIPSVETLGESQVQALYAAIAAPSVERLG